PAGPTGIGPASRGRRAGPVAKHSWPGAIVGCVGRRHGHQIDPEVTQPVQQPVQVRLVTDLSDEHSLAAPRLQHHPIKGGLEPFAEPPAQHNAVYAAGTWSTPA